MRLYSEEAKDRQHSPLSKILYKPLQIDMEDSKIALILL